jgi:hypothetical protein
VGVEGQLRKRAEQVQATCRIESKKGEFLAVPFAGLLSSAQYVPGLLNLAGVEFQVFGGSVQARGSYRLASGEWEVLPAIKKISLADVMDRMTPYRDLFSGAFSGEFDLKGQTGREPPAPPQGTGTFRVSRGEFKNFDLVGAVLAGLFQIKSIAPLLTGSGGEAAKYAATRFDGLEGRFSLEERVLRIEALQLRNLRTAGATDADAVLEGRVSLADDTLDMRGRVLLSGSQSQELARKASILEALRNPEGRMVLPFTLTGNLQRPTPLLDAEYVVGAVTRFYTRKGAPQGLDRLREDLGIRKKGEPGTQKPIDDLLRGLIRE